jgi:hypothetical protein
VRRWLVHAGIDRRRSAPRPAPAPHNECVELHQAGWSAPEIAYHLGCSSVTVFRRLEAAGTARRHVTGRVSRVELVAGLERGLSHTQAGGDGWGRARPVSAEPWPTRA